MKNNQGNTVTWLRLENIHQLLSNKQIIGADISWMCEWQNEDEWAILPVQFYSNEKQTGMQTYHKLN